MGKFIVRILGVIVALAIVSLPALFGALSSGQDTGTDPAVVKKYDAVFDVDAKGTLTATETLLVNFPVSKHGIFRFFDQQDPNDSRVRLRPEGFSVTRDGQSEEIKKETKGQGRYVNYRIGNPNVTITGDHVYVLKYQVRGVLSKGTGGTPTQFYYNLIPGGWQMQIAESSLTARLPAKPQQIKCAVGAGSTAGCTPTVEGNTLRVTTGPLAPNTPVTVNAGLDLPTPDRVTSAWPMAWDRVLGKTGLVAGLAALLSVGAAWLGARMSKSVQEKDPPFPLSYAPPKGIGPAQGRYILQEKIDQQSFVSALMETGAEGATILERTDDGWTVSSTGDEAAWQRLDSGSGYAAQLLSVKSTPFHTKKDDVTTGKQLQKAVETFTSETKSWASSNQLMTKAGLGGLNVLIIVVAAIAAGLMIFKTSMPSILALIPLVFVVFGLQVLLPGASTKRTETGRRMWSELGGFHRVLSTPSSEARFDFSGRQELYTKYIPWAVAFGCAKEWAEKYRIEMQSDPPEPSYMRGSGFYAGASAASFADNFASDFESTVSSAISSYEATQSSSSGGGFSGGGGGGGGGGGSW